MIGWNRLFAIMLASLLLAAANAWLNPSRPAWSQATLREGELWLADALSDAPPVLWVDARSAEEYAQAHIPGAVLLNEDAWDALLPEFLAAWAPDRRTVVYCGSEQCQASASVAERLRGEVGLDEVYVLKEGWEAWQTHEK